MKFYSFDLDLYQMTLVLKLDLDIVKMYACTENEVSSFSGSKVIAWTGIQRFEFITYLQMRYV